MICLKLEAQFDDENQIIEMEKKYHIAIKNISKVLDVFSPDPIYLFIGTLANIEKYLLGDYGMDIEELEEVRKYIQEL